MTDKKKLESNNSLFRKEVLEYKKTKNLGKVIIATPISFTFWSIGIFILSLALVLFLCFGKYTRRQEVSGMLMPNKGLINVYAEKPGIIVEKFVQQGDKIQKGQLLYTISTEQYTSSEKSLFIQQLELLEKQIAVQKNRVDILQKEVSKYKDLAAKGFISESDYQKKNDSYLSERLSLHKLEQNMTQIKGEGSYTIRASCDGRISALIAMIGDRVTQQKPLISVIPEGAKLQGMLFVPAHSIGFIKSGQKVLLKYQAYPYQQFGLYESTIDHIDKSMLSPKDINIPIDMKTAFYRVTVTLKSQQVKVYGKFHQLTAGMLFDASILSEECSIWEWIMRPIYSLKGNITI